MTYDPVPALVLLSGGLDSAATLAYAIEAHGTNPGNVRALSVNYGQRHVRELDRAIKLAEHYGISKYHDIVFLEGFASLARHSALTSPAMAIPRGTPEGVPDTYVPHRNLFLFALAAARLESYCLHHISQGNRFTKACIYYGAHADDWGGYPDCRDEWLGPMGEALLAGSKLNVEYGIPIFPIAPFVESSKREVVEWAREHDVPIDLTWSCYQGDVEPCGACPTCISRAEALGE